MVEPVRLLILSDLHNDIKPMKPVVDGRRIDEQADVVVLAGDIHEGDQSPEWARKAFPNKPIVLVAGNHEFYGRNWTQNLHEIREKSKALGIHFLENDFVDIEGVRFLGATLWTDFLIHGEDLRPQGMADAGRKMNDYIRIRLDDKEPDPSKLQPEETRRRHHTSVEWLEKQLDDCDPYATVIVTHHAPCEKSVPKHHAGHPLTPAYASNLNRMMGRAAYWIHGHIHYNANYTVSGTRVVCNPRGYPDAKGKSTNPSFNPFFTVEV